MRKSLKSGFAGVLCASIAAIAFPSEGSAGPVSVAAPDLVGMTQQVEQIHYRRGPRRYAPQAYYPRRRYGVDVNAAIAGGLAVAGAAVATHPYYYGYGGYGYPYYGYGYGGYPGYPGYYGGWGW
jgi:hypothetical protein